MDPRTTYPFWDYDFAPRFSALWISKIQTAIACLRQQRVTRQVIAQLLAGPSVARKELIYSLFDMKVARLSRDDRLIITSFWIRLLKYFCQDDWPSDGANRAVGLDNVEQLRTAPTWRSPSPEHSRTLAGLTVALNALSYSLYSDVFTHQCAETRGPYLSGGLQLLVRSWVGLNPVELWPEWSRLPFEAVTVVCAYDALDPVIDIYNHTRWRGNAPAMLRGYAINIDGAWCDLSMQEVEKTALLIAERASAQHSMYAALGFEAHKQLWIRQRNFQFKRLFAAAGMSWHAPEMEAAVANVSLCNDPYWRADLPCQQRRQFLMHSLDPRHDAFYDEWASVFASSQLPSGRDN